MKVVGEGQRHLPVHSLMTIEACVDLFDDCAGIRPFSAGWAEQRR